MCASKFKNKEVNQTKEHNFQESDSKHDLRLLEEFVYAEFC